MLKALFGDLTAIDSHRGWSRFDVDAEAWKAIGQALREGKLDLMGEWGDDDAVHCALFEPPTRGIALATIAANEGRVPTLAAFHPAAMRLERAIADLWGLEITGLPDRRPWLDHGRWGRAAPLGAQRESRAPAAAYRFLESEGPSLHQIAVGPVHAGIIEPGHFRFTANGETVVRLEQRLGYTHKGVEGLLRGRTIANGAPVAARVSGDSTVAYSLAFARAAEAALGAPAPPRGAFLRGVMAELERIANHLGDIGAVCNDAAFAMMHAECGILREQALRACDLAFGHRLMMDRIVPGGTTVDLTQAGREAILALTHGLRRRFPELVELYENTASLQDRTVGTGVVSPTLAADFAAGGFVGRASGRAFDARAALAYEPYDALPVKAVVRSEGDVDARIWVRIEEVSASADWLESALAALPAGPVRHGGFATPRAAAEATAIVEGFRGDVLAYLRLGPDGCIERCHLRDPSWFQWPLLETAIDGNIVADFPLCNKSFNCSYSGHDL